MTSSSCLYAEPQAYFVREARRLRTAVLCSALNRADKVCLRHSQKTRGGCHPMKMGGPSLDRPPSCNPSLVGLQESIMQVYGSQGLEESLLSSTLGSDSGEDPTSTSLTVVPKQVTSALSQLISCYGSASDSDSEPEEIPMKKISEAIEENRHILEAHRQSTDSVPANVKTKNTSEVSNADSCSTELKPKVSHNKSHTNKGRNNTKRPVNTKRRNTLLEMLLARDIRHERNVILQCVRYIVQNRFFEATLNNEVQVSKESSPAKLTDLNGERKSKVKSEHYSGLDDKKMPVTSSVLRPLDPVDDEIWETNASCMETFAV
ncbi:unnamed protein product [Ranitomeya imitator]|uniref:Uncharacterized protein n=1 Tax=Ranitomeya imitator TaxID=111125 RepID=A0ABN9M1X0_9NEOB|nr:unnamed protein product [Ranitomeya imitator]